MKEILDVRPEVSFKDGVKVESLDSIIERCMAIRRSGNEFRLLGLSERERGLVHARVAVKLRSEQYCIDSALLANDAVTKQEKLDRENGISDDERAMAWLR